MQLLRSLRLISSPNLLFPALAVVQAIVLAQQVLAVIVPIRGTNDRVNMLASGDG